MSYLPIFILLAFLAALAFIAYRAFKEKKTVRQLLGETDLLSPEEVAEVLDPKSMIGGPG